MSRPDDSAVPGHQALTISERARLAGEGYQRWARDLLRCLDQLTAGMAAAHGDRDPRLLELRDIFRIFERRLRQHLAWEDAQLLPLLATAAPGAAADGLIGELTRGHAELGALLDRLAGLSDHFTAPGWASLDHRLMLDQLQQLAEQTREHLDSQRAVLGAGHRAR